MCLGFSNFSAFLYHFVLAKLATSSIRVKKEVLLTNNAKQATAQKENLVSTSPESKNNKKLFQKTSSEISPIKKTNI